jgi:hypothetical protein
VASGAAHAETYVSTGYACGMDMLGADVTAVQNMSMIEGRFKHTSK